MIRFFLILLVLLFSRFGMAETECAPSYTAFYVNGMHTPPDTSVRNIVRLKETMLGKFPEKSSTKFIRLYNIDGWSQYLEVLYQKLSEQGLDDTEISRYFFTSIYAPFTLSLATVVALESASVALEKGRSVNQETYEDIKNKFLKRSNEDQSDYQLIFAHSQGNFYANQLISDSSVASGRQIGFIGIAVPANDVISSFDGVKYYVTAYQDKVINNVRSAFSDTLPGNVIIDHPDAGFLFHGLEDSYLKDAKSVAKIRGHLSEIIVDNKCDLPLTDEYVYWIINGRLVVSDESLFSIGIPGESYGKSHRLIFDGAVGGTDDWIKVDVRLPEDSLGVETEPRQSYEIVVDDDFTYFGLLSSLKEGALFEPPPSFWRALQYRINTGEQDAGTVSFSHSLSNRRIVGCAETIDDVCTIDNVKYTVVTTGSFDVMMSDHGLSEIPYATNNVTGGFRKAWECMTEEPRTMGKYSGTCPK